MNRPTTVDEVLALYEERGLEHYGESVSQLDHALQCAALALADGADETLGAAALLHDIGHLVVDVQADEGYQMGVDDDVHESVGAKVLAPIFGPAVAQPVALHVTAKRYGRPELSLVVVADLHCDPRCTRRSTRRGRMPSLRTSSGSRGRAAPANMGRHGEDGRDGHAVARGPSPAP